MVMTDTIDVVILKVFTDALGKHGNLVSIIIDEEKEIHPSLRQKIPQKLGHDESVFINDITSGNVSIFSPQREIKFAGHAIVGTAWFLNKLRSGGINSVNCLGREIAVWQEGELTWVQASLEMMPPWHYIQYGNAGDVEHISPADAAKMEHTVVWAWIEDEKGTVRARTFAPDWGIPESQGNGSGSMILASILKRKLEIKHGKGSLVYANVADHNEVALGGRVVEDKYINIYGKDI